MRYRTTWVDYIVWLSVLVLLGLSLSWMIAPRTQPLGFYTHCTLPQTPEVITFVGRTAGLGIEVRGAWVIRGMRTTITMDSLKTVRSTPFTLTLRMEQLDFADTAIVRGEFREQGHGVWQGPSLCVMLGYPTADSSLSILYRER